MALVATSLTLTPQAVQNRAPRGKSMLHLLHITFASETNMMPREESNWMDLVVRVTSQSDIPSIENTRVLGVETCRKGAAASL
jgi:hypothetical protein